MGRPFKFHQLSGKRVGQLTVTDTWERRTKGSRTRTYWKCVCDCGKETWGTDHALLAERKKSCGCLFDSTEEYGVADLRARYRSYKAGARKRDIQFCISITEFQEIASKDCHYCGAVAFERQLRPHLNGGSVFNGIDRVDSNGPYNRDNCVPCCAVCNYMKRDMGYEEFIDHCLRVTEEFRRKKCCFMASSNPLR